MPTKKKSYKEHEFSQEYFETNLVSVGKFSRKDLYRAKRWFWGQFNYFSGMVPSIKQGQGKKALEIGCSIGGAADLLCDYGYDVLATDISTYAINKTKKILPGLKLKVLDIENDLLSRENFDLICAFEVLEHLKDPEKALNNIYNGLKVGGHFIASTPYPFPKYLAIPTHINVKKPSEWKKIFKKSGFKEDETFVKEISFLPFLYRYSHWLSRIIPIGLNLPLVNSTMFIVAKK